MKKLIIALCFCFTLFPGLTAFGYNDNVGETISYVLDVYDDVICVVGELLMKQGFERALLCVGNALIYDLRTGFRVFPKDIKKDMDIRRAYYIPTC